MGNSVSHRSDCPHQSLRPQGLLLHDLPWVLKVVGFQSDVLQGWSMYLPTYTVLYHPIPSYAYHSLSILISPYNSMRLSIFRGIRLRASPYIKKMYSGELSGSRELRKNTLNTIIGSYCKPASWQCSHRCFILALKLHLRLRTMLPLRSRSSSAKFDACLAASTRKGQVAHGSTTEKGDAGNAGPVALRSWCWRFFDALSCVGIHALCKSREIKARQSAMNAVRLPDRIKQMTHQSILWSGKMYSQPLIWDGLGIYFLAASGRLATTLWGSRTLIQRSFHAGSLYLGAEHPSPSHMAHMDPYGIPPWAHDWPWYDGFKSVGVCISDRAWTMHTEADSTIFHTNLIKLLVCWSTSKYWHDIAG